MSMFILYIYFLRFLKLETIITKNGIVHIFQKETRRCYGHRCFVVVVPHQCRIAKRMRYGLSIPGTTK